MHEEQYYNTKKEIMYKFLDNLVFDSCNDDVLEKTLKEFGYQPSYVRIFFPEGIKSLLNFFSEEIDKEQNKQLNIEYLSSLKISERIFIIIKTRLELFFKHKEAIRNIINYHIKPSNMKNSFSVLWHNVDFFWKLAGDQSSDFNFYSKRLILSPIYVSTLLYWLKDSSVDHQQSWSFLQRRIDNVMKMNRIKLFGKNVASKINQVPFLRIITKRIF